MDEKGFMAGVTGKQKRMFSKVSIKLEHAWQSSHDGSREWIALIACVFVAMVQLFPRASSVRLAPQSNWVSDVDKKKHLVYTTVSTSG